MDVEYPGFGTIVVDGTRYDHDVVIEAGIVRARDKGPSKAAKVRFGHTPLSASEDIPWSKPRLIIGSGHSARLPIMDDVRAAATQRGITLEVMPTAAACALLRTLDATEVNAVLHVTC
jgi:hypothetical protein